MALFSWFQRRPAEEDYEQVLATLALSVEKRRTKLSEIRLRERRASILVTSWAFAAWAAYVGLWWAGMLGRKRGVASGLWGVPVVLGPVVVLFTRRIVQLWYARKGNAEEKTLKTLLVQQRNKIEEIKKKTNYYTTKNLLDRYDDGPTRRVQPGSTNAGAQKNGTTPARQPRDAPNGTTPVRAQQAPQTPDRREQGQPFSPTLPPLPAPRKQWYDKLADAILGDDTASTGPSPASRYALICERCFTHNGLVKEEQWEHAQYVCPKCGHFNASMRARKAGAVSPTSPTYSQSAVGPGRPQPSSPAPISQSAPAPRAPSPEMPLSASTVIVENPDLRDETADGRGGTEGSDTTTHMEVDS